MLHSGCVVVDGIKIALDDASSELCFVSHAHTDHTGAFRKKGKSIIASDETFCIMGSEPHITPRLPISLHPAGHMLGARQLLAKTENGTFVYTGDFSLHSSYTSHAAKVLPCDTLMIDATYCLPHLRLPARHTVVNSMCKFVKQHERKIVVFGAYVRGKSQELVRMLNIECGIAPVVNSDAAKFCEFYKKSGVSLDYVAAGTPEAEEAMRHPFVAIMPARTVNFSFGSQLSEAFGHEVKTAVATGWAAVSRFPVDAAFPLSDHADFKDTMRYIYESGAKEVICANSGAQAASEYLQTLGIDACTKSDYGLPIQTKLDVPIGASVPASARKTDAAWREEGQKEQSEIRL